MKLRSIFSCALVAGIGAVFVGCGGETNEGTASGSPSGSTSATSGSGGAGGGGGEGQGGSKQTGSGGSGGGGGATGAGGGGGASAGGLVPKLKSMEMYVDCMPIVPADPVHGQFLVDYDTTTAMGPSSATITSAKLLFGGASNWSFSVMPNGSGNLAPGAVIQVAHVKQNASGSGDMGPCNFCNGTWSLEVTFDVNGSSIVRTLPAEPVSCVF